MRIHHVALVCEDVAGIAAFYGGLLELPELARHDDEAGLRSVWLGLDESILMVERGSRGAGGWHLLALEIRPEERERWRERLARWGAGPTHETAWTLYGRDPEGNPFGLSAWSAQPRSS